MGGGQIISRVLQNLTSISFVRDRHKVQLIGPCDAVLAGDKLMKIRSSTTEMMGDDVADGKGGQFLKIAV